jgi:hypothetical protein
MSWLLCLKASLKAGAHDALHASRRPFVDPPQERAYLSHRLDEILEFHRLDHMGIDAELVAVQQILLFARGRRSRRIMAG